MFNWLKHAPPPEPEYNPRNAPSTDEDTQPYFPVTLEEPTIKELLQTFVNSGYDANGREKDE